MYALKSIHRWLRYEGMLLDLHPEPEQPDVDVIAGDYAVHLGRIDNTSLIANIHRARKSLTSLVGQGWFELDRSVVFDFVSHFPSVDDWLRHRQRRRSTSIVDPAMVARARELLPAQMSGELRVSERMLATRLLRVDGPA